MSQILDPITSRDFSEGRIGNYAVSPALSPANSVSNSQNVDFSEIIGSGIVRKGKTHIVRVAGTSRTDQSFSSPNSGDQLPVYDTNWLAQTFTPSISAEFLSITLQLYLVGAPQGYVTMAIQGVSGGLPNGINLYEPVTFDLSQISQTSYPGGNYTFYFIGASQFVLSGTPLAIVLSYPAGDGAHNLEWMRNSASSISGGQASHSTNSGSTWSTTTGVFCFIQQVVNTAVPYSSKPLGNFSFLVNGIGRNVVAFTETVANKAVIFYFDPGGGAYPNWRPSTLSYLTLGKFIRFAELNGSVFEVNGSEPMHDSADYGATWGTTNSITTDSVVPSLLLAAQNIMLASGYSGFPSRIYFSSVIDPSSSPFITWDTTPSNGNFIDINPGVDGSITGLIPNSSLVLVFKTNAMYRLNIASKSIDAENIFNVGAVSQECIVNCLGITYFYSGNGIYSTDSTFPKQISRIGVQDYIDAIVDQSQVYAWTDGFNVYFSIGAVNITNGAEDFRSYSNVVLKFSPRDQNWQIFTYNQRLAQTTLFGPEPAFGFPVQLLGTEYDGYLSTVNSSLNSDDGQAIPYYLETQEQEFGNRAHTKDISDKIVVFTRNGGDGMFLVKQNDGNFKSANIQTNNRVNVGTDINFESEFFIFRWQGQALGQRPVFEGYHLPKVTDLGIPLNSNTPN